LIRILRGFADGSYDGPAPRAEDLYRFQTEAVTYVDRYGFASPSTGQKGPDTWADPNIVDPLARTTDPLVIQRCGQLSTKYNSTNNIEHTQPDEFSPMNFLAGFTGLPFGAPASTLAKGGGSDQLPRLDANRELATYSNLMMDSGMSARFSEEDFMNSILFGLTPPPLAMENTRIVQGAEFPLFNISSE
jgi:hypothetical protein